MGVYIALYFRMFLIHTFIAGGWDRFGAAIWLGPFFAIPGGAAGDWLVHWWTEPAPDTVPIAERPSLGHPRSTLPCAWSWTRHLVCGAKAQRI